MPTKADGERYERWKLVEQQRRWALGLIQNPIIVLEEEDRVMPETSSLVEAFWHPVGCSCGSCEGPFAKQAKEIRLTQRPPIPSVTSLVSRLPPLPHQIELRLLVVEAEARLREGVSTLSPGEPAEQPSGPEDS